MIKILFLLCACIALNSNAAVPPKKNVHSIIEQMNFLDEESVLSAGTSKDQLLVDKIINYLNNTKTIAAEFIQVASDGSNSDGMFFLSRPGKLRWQYNPPTPILIIINNKNLTYYDYELEEVSYAKTHDVLGSFLTDNHINFDGKMLKTEVENQNNLIKLTVTNPSKNSEKMIMIFNNKPFELKKMEFFDSSGNVTSVSLHNAKYNHELDDSLFTIKNPRVFGKPDL